MKSSLLFVPAMATALFLASCGGGNESKTSTTAADTATTQTTTTEAPGSDIPGIDSVKVTDHIQIDGWMI